MKAGTEWIVAILRGGPEFQEFGDPFEFSCMIIRNGDVCEIKGLSCKGGFNLEIARSIEKALLEIGIVNASWERKKNGASRLKGRTRR